MLSLPSPLQNSKHHLAALLILFTMLASGQDCTAIPNGTIPVLPCTLAILHAVSYTLACLPACSAGRAHLLARRHRAALQLAP